jgi:apolipoprotein D and lipocalin family protein
MRAANKIWSIALLGLSVSACAMGAGPMAAAPPPAKPIDPAKFYTGRWYEFARTPTMFTDGCVAGTTDFYTTDYGQLFERDACRRGGPTGPEKVFQGPAIALNPGENTKFVVHYVLFGVVPFAQTYWILDHADDYSWFIVATPSFQNVAILGRAPRPSDTEIAALTARTRRLGYDTSKLEFPERFAPGEQ